MPAGARVEMVSGGAALGVLIGVIAGNGRGVVGGVGAEIFTRGNEGRVPAEMILKVTFEKDLRLGVTG